MSGWNKVNSSSCLAASNIARSPTRKPSSCYLSRPQHSIPATCTTNVPLKRWSGYDVAAELARIPQSKRGPPVSSATGTSFATEVLINESESCEHRSAGRHPKRRRVDRCRSSSTWHSRRGRSSRPRSLPDVRRDMPPDRPATRPLLARHLHRRRALHGRGTQKALVEIHVGTQTDAGCSAKSLVNASHLLAIILAKRGTLMDISTIFMPAIVNAFEANKRMADRAIEQLPADKLRIALDPNTNSIAIIMKHVAGNLLSRWTDFLTTDGEKTWRNRDDEFVDSFGSRKEILDYWERGWACVFTTLKSLKPEDLSKTVFIRGEAHTVPLALERSLGHTCYHIGQIVQVARVQAGDNWKTLTIPRGESAKFNKEKWGQTGKSHS